MYFCEKVLKSLIFSYTTVLTYVLTAQKNLLVKLHVCFVLNFARLVPGCVAQMVTCLATDASLTGDPGVASSIPAQSHTFVELDHEIISTVILLPSAESFKKGCCQLQAKVCTKVHEVLVNGLFKLAQEKVWLGELTVPPWPWLLTWDVKQQNKQTKLDLYCKIPSLLDT